MKRPTGNVEAMFAGLPMAASRVGRITEAITDGKISLLLVGSGDVKGLRFTAPG